MAIGVYQGDEESGEPQTLFNKSRIIGVATSTTGGAYSQEDLLNVFQVADPKVRSLFLNGGIKRRFLSLPDSTYDGGIPTETQGQLLRKHYEKGIELGALAIRRCLSNVTASPNDVRYICCVTTTGFLTPGFSAHLCRHLGLPHDAGRLDVVGMGCNAGLNALNAVSAWSEAHAGQLALMCCIEVCSAAYVFDGTMRTAVVNSLFGDGAAAIAVRSDEQARIGCRIIKFASCLIPEAIEAMRYDWDDQQGKFSFFLARDIPYVIGAHCENVLERLLFGTGLRKNNIKHWLVHSGGKKVIDAVKINLGLTNHDLRHTSDVLRDYGNISSGSFLFSLERLMLEGVVEPDDFGVMMTMGPGSTIEMALVQW